MNQQDDCSIFFRNTPTPEQMACFFRLPNESVSSLLKLTDSLASHYIKKWSDYSVDKSGLSKALAIKILQEGIHYAVTKADKLKTTQNSKFYYKRKLPHYSLLTSDIKAKVEGRKQGV